MSPLAHPRHLAVCGVAAVLMAATAACGGGGDGGDSTSARDSPSATAAGGAHLTVLAAASLTDVFKQEATAFQKQNPGDTVTFSFAGSQDLAAQVRQGVPADALVTADTRTMDGVRSDTGTPTIIARNRLVIAVGKGNPKKVTGLKDLSDPHLKVVLAAPQVPVGNYSKKVLDAQKITVKAVSQEADVRAVLSKVALGEADAGIVYVTDATTAQRKVSTVTIPDDQNAIASYPAATLNGSEHPQQARAFVQWLGSPQGQQILRAAGFGQP